MAVDSAVALRLAARRDSGSPHGGASARRVAALRLAGHLCFDFRDPAGFVFSGTAVMVVPGQAGRGPVMVVPGRAGRGPL